jgi:Flp pilus assembly protein TadD
MRRALVRMELRKFVDAEADFRSALRENPTHCQLRVLLAVCLQRRGDTTTAQDELKMALSMASDGNEESSLRRLFNRLARPQ